MLFLWKAKNWAKIKPLSLEERDLFLLISISMVARSLITSIVSSSRLSKRTILCMCGPIWLSLFLADEEKRGCACVFKFILSLRVNNFKYQMFQSFIGYQGVGGQVQSVE